MYQKLFSKNIPWKVRTGPDANIANIKNSTFTGQVSFTHDSHRLFVSNDTAGSGNATLTEVATIDSLINSTGASTALTQEWNGKKQNVDPTSNTVLFTVASGALEKGFESRFIVTTNTANNFSISGADGVSINGVNNTVVNYNNTYQNKYIDVEATADNALVIQVLETTPTPSVAASDLTSFDFAGNAVYSLDADWVLKTGNFTFQSGDGGRNHLVSGANSITGTVPSGLRDKIGFIITQVGSGSFVPSGEGGVVSINNRQSHTQTAGIYATASVFSIGGNNFVFAGDTTT